MTEKGPYRYSDMPEWQWNGLVTEHERSYMDNPPACGADPNWRWGFLPCGCHNDGYGRHVR